MGWGGCIETQEQKECPCHSAGGVREGFLRYLVISSEEDRKDVLGKGSVQQKMPKS